MDLFISLTSLVLGRPTVLKPDDCHFAALPYGSDADLHTTLQTPNTFLRESTKLNYLLVKALHRLYNSLDTAYKKSIDVKFVLEMDNQIADWERDLPPIFQPAAQIVLLDHTPTWLSLQSKVMTLRYIDSF